MSGEVFRERTTTESSATLDKNEKTVDKFDERSYAVGKETETSKEFSTNLEAWETESKKKYVNEYFDTHKLSADFSAKMLLGTIDKFVRSELEERKFAKTLDNYKYILNEIEEEIGSNRLELFERFKKLTGYIKTMGRLKEIKKKLGAYKPNVRVD